MEVHTRATHWSLTINNPTDDDEECMQLARQRGWKIDGQKERGKEGTEHYQLHVQTPQVRFAAVKKMFPRAHIEIARNPSALAAYVTKEDTRVGGLVSAQEKYPSQSKFFDLIWDEIISDPGKYDFRFGTRRFMHNGSTENASKAHRRSYWAAASALIRKGYHVESMAVNPMTLSSWDAFHLALLDRKIAGETERQTDSVQMGENKISTE